MEEKLNKEFLNVENHSKFPKQGIALLMVVIFMFSLSVMGIAFSTMVNVGLRQTNISLLDLKLFYTAEAGLEKSVWYLRQGEVPSLFKEEFEGLIYEVSINKIQGNKYNIVSKVFKQKRGIEINVQIIKDLLTNNFIFVSGTYYKKFIKRE